MDSIEGAELAANLVAYELTFGDVELEQLLRVDRLEYQPMMAAAFRGEHNLAIPQSMEKMPLMANILEALPVLFTTVTGAKMAVPAAYIAAYGVEKHYIPPVR